MFFNKLHLGRCRKVLLVRPDNIGDVVLTLPMAGIIKTYFPEIKVAFLGRAYTEPVIRKSKFVDEFYDWTRMSANPVSSLRNCAADIIIHVYPDKKIVTAAKQADIPFRIGTGRRWFNWMGCNRLVWLKRKGSCLHESQLNVRLLSPLGIGKIFDIDELPEYYGWQTKGDESFDEVLKKDKCNIVLHPKSQGHGCEWKLQNYCRLARLLPKEDFHVLISGSKGEGIAIQQECPELLALPHVTNITGHYDLATFIALIGHVDCLIASGTGPVHLAAAAGIATIGLYPPVRPVHPGRWQPIGRKTHVLCKGQLTTDKKDLDKINAITPQEVKHIIMSTGGIK